MYDERDFLILTAILEKPLSMGFLMEAVKHTHGATKKSLDKLANESFLTLVKSETFPFEATITITESGKILYRKLKEISNLRE